MIKNLRTGQQVVEFDCVVLARCCGVGGVEEIDLDDGLVCHAPVMW